MTVEQMATRIRDLEIERDALRVEVESLRLPAKAAAHLAKLQALADPLEARLQKLATSKKPRKGVALTAAEVSALNQIYKQMATIEGLLVSAGAGRVRAAREARVKTSVPAQSGSASLESLANIVALKKSG